MNEVGTIRTFALGNVNRFRRVKTETKINLAWSDWRLLVGEDKRHEYEYFIYSFPSHLSHDSYARRARHKLLSVVTQMKCLLVMTHGYRSKHSIYFCDFHTYFINSMSQRFCHRMSWALCVFETFAICVVIVVVHSDFQWKVFLTRRRFICRWELVRN